MTNELLNNPEARFNAALSFATSEFQGQIDQGAYTNIPTPYFAEIYANEYFSLVEDVLDVVKSIKDIDTLFSQLVEVTKKRAQSLNEQAIENGKVTLAKELGSYPEDMPDADNYEEVERLWDEA